MKGSVLIIGAGVAGMRAASELLQQRFKVYLLEGSPRIGGMMATIDRLFPTNEHAACAIQPLTLDILNNPNAKIITSAELLSLTGEPGEFRVEILREQASADASSPKLEINVGAVIVATGLEEEKSDALSRLGHGRYPNVLTGLEFEQQLAGLGPTGGVVRPTSVKEPARVAWVVLQDEWSLSFMSASSQASAVLEKNKDAQVSILYEERMTDGNGYEQYCQATEKQGVKFIQANALEVSDTQSGNIILSYTSTDGKKTQLETDMLVLSTQLVPRDNTKVLAERLGLELDERGYFRQSAGGHPVLTSRKGVFVCGSAQGPKGIGESVIQACAAVSHAAALLASERGSELDEYIEKKLFPVKPTDEPKIVVLIDQGEPDVQNLLDLDELAAYTQTLPGVTRVEVTPSVFDGSKIMELLSTGNYNRLIVAGPSPIPHESLFQRFAEKAGLNPYLLEIVNLNNQCARVHSDDRTQATEKARVLMKMGVVRARLLEPLEELKISITQSCLIIGGFASGVACATKLAEMGLQVHLVDGAPDLQKIPGNDHPLVRPLVAGLPVKDYVQMHTPAMVEDIQGRMGNFKVELIQQGNKMTVEVGTIVVAEKPGARSTAGPKFEESLRLEKNEDGFYASTQGILNLLDFTTAGVFSCGPARATLKTENAVVDGEAAASRAACILASSVLTRPPAISSVVDTNCDGCAYCVDPCPTQSISLLEFIQRGSVKKVVEVSDATCIGCGICMSTCPKKGILVKHFKSETFAEMVKVAIEGSDSQPVIVSFCCNRCAYPGADGAGTAGIQYPTSVRIIRTVCSGMIHPNIIMDALNQGADGVLLCGCHPGNCRSRDGIRKAQDRAEAIELMLEDFGLEPERFRLELVAASEGPKFARVVREMTEELAALGPNPYK